MSISRQSNMKRQLMMSAGILAGLTAAGFAMTRKPASPPSTAPTTLSEAVTLSDRGAQVADIATATVARQAVSAEIRATGQVLYPADQTVKVSPRMQGRVRQVYVKVGDHVSAGHALALLDSVDAATAQTAARQYENKLRLAGMTLERCERLFRLGTPEVTSAQSALEQAQSAAASAKEALERTKQQAGIGGFAQPPLEAAQSSVNAAKGALAQAQSDLAQAQRDRDRKARLVEIGVAAKSDLEGAENVLEKARNAVQSDAESLKLAQQALNREERALRTNLYSEQQVRSAEAGYRQATLLVAGAERALRLARAAVLTSVQQARSDYQAAQADAENSRRVLQLLGAPDANGCVRIVAPITGVVTDRQVNPGQIVDQSQMTPWQMFVLSNTAVVWVDADVFEKDIASVMPGQRVSIRVNALHGQEFRGRVLRIAPGVDRASRAFKVRVEIPNPAGALKDGMYAAVTIYPTGGRSVVTVPASAVQHDGDSDFVYAAVNGKYVRRKVVLGLHFGDRYEICAGLRAGDAVVSRGAIFLDNRANGS